MLWRWWEQYLDWWKTASFSKKVIILGVLLATIGGAAFRLVLIPETMQFLADQGRDALIAYNILHGDIALVGPSTSVGSMFLGPLYYYFMSPFLALAAWSPVGPAYAISVIGIATIPLLYWVGEKFVGRWPAFFATILYATAPYVTEYTRFSWNPNPAPFVMLLLLYSTWRAWRGSAWWWLSVAFWFAVIIQLHYVALLAAGPAGLFWLADCVRTLRTKDSVRGRHLVSATLLAAALIVASFAPLFVFNWKFNNIILNGFKDFFSKEKGLTAVSPGQKFTAIFLEQHGRGMQILFELWGREWTVWYREINTFLLVAYALILGWGIRVYSRTKYFAGYLLILATIGTSIFGLSFYKSSVFYHYFTYFYPVSYLATGLVVTLLARIFSWPGKLMGAALLIYVFGLSVLPAQLLYLKPLGWKTENMKATAMLVKDIVPDGSSYSLALLSEIRDYRGLNYRYFLETSDEPPTSFETSHEAEYLVVIAESPREAEEVLSSPVYEIDVFPKGEYTVHEVPNGPLIYLIKSSQKFATQTMLR